MSDERDRNAPSERSTKKRRRRRRPRKRGSRKGKRSDGDVQKAEKQRSSPSSTPWSKERADEEQKTRERKAQRRRREEAREVDPRKVYADRPVLLRETEDVEEQFLDDLVEPPWNIDGEWVRVVEVISPYMRARQEADAGDHYIEPGDDVILSTQRGIERATVLDAPEWVEREADLKSKVLRCAGYSDSRQMTRNESKSLDAFELCARLVEEKGLKMKLMRVEYMHGGGKAVFYFTAEKRVDFRQLIRDLAGQLHIRIEMRQIGVRDAARLVGGVGPCGQEVCCNRFLAGFSPVSIKMAKVQNLQLNPQKVSGVCGRLLCCLEYEYEQYRRMLAEAPRVGRHVDSPHGKVRIKELMLLDRKCVCEREDGSKLVCPWSELSYESRAGSERGRRSSGDGRQRSRRSRGRNDAPAGGGESSAARPARDDREPARSSEEAADDQ
jgi:cell fate regulator YaaT (PSP1 superfamily)